MNLPNKITMARILMIPLMVIIPFLGIILIFPTIGLVLTIMGILLNVNANKISKNYVEVIGYYKDKIYASTDDGTKLYNLEYLYTVNGDQYVIETDYITNIIPKYGSEKKIKYNPENPSEAIISGFNSYYIMIITGIGFLIISSILIIPMTISHVKIKLYQKRKY